MDVRIIQKNEHGTAEFAEGRCLDHMNLCGSLRTLRYKYHLCFHPVNFRCHASDVPPGRDGVGGWESTVETVGENGMSLRDKKYGGIPDPTVKTVG